jgi:hypothetical protein
MLGASMWPALHHPQRIEELRPEEAGAARLPREYGERLEEWTLTDTSVAFRLLNDRPWHITDWKVRRRRRLPRERSKRAVRSGVRKLEGAK